MIPDWRLQPASVRALKARILIATGLWTALLIVSMSATAQGAAPETQMNAGLASLMEQAPQINWTYLRGDTLSGHADKEVQLEGNAQIQRNDTQINADSVRFDQRNDRMQAAGNVRIERNARTYTGSYLDMDVERFEGFFTDISYQLGGKKGHGEALRADFADKDHMTAHQGTYTTCRRKPGPGWVPEWVLTATQLHIDNEQEIDNTEIHVGTSVFADTLTINDRKHMTTAYYNQDRTFDSVEIL